MEKKKITPDRKKEGAGANIYRLFPSSDTNHLDPFVLFDEFMVEPDKGFPMHKHAGFEAITYIIEGEFRHRDDLGNDSIVGKNGIQKFTAGKGIEHSEMPEGDEKTHGFQLWVNLPRGKKNVEPNYERIQSEYLPETKDGKARIRTIIGEVSPVNLETTIVYQDINLEKNSFTSIDIPEQYNGFLYVYAGEIIIETNEKDMNVSHREGFIFEDGERVSIGSDSESKIIVLSGQPIGDDIRLEGSVVR